MEMRVEKRLESEETLRGEVVVLPGLAFVGVSVLAEAAAAGGGVSCWGLFEEEGGDGVRWRCGGGVGGGVVRVLVLEEGFRGWGTWD